MNRGKGRKKKEGFVLSSLNNFEKPSIASTESITLPSLDSSFLLQKESLSKSLEPILRHNRHEYGTKLVLHRPLESGPSGPTFTSVKLTRPVLSSNPSRPDLSPFNTKYVQI